MARLPVLEAGDKLHSDHLPDDVLNTAAILADPRFVQAVRAVGAAGTGDIANGAVTWIKLDPATVTEGIEDAIAALLVRSTHAGASWTYNDATGTLSLIVGSAGGGMTLDDMPSGYMHWELYNGVAWPSTRPTTRTDIHVTAYGSTVGPTWIDDVPGDRFERDV